VSERIDDVARRLRDEETAQNVAANTHLAWKRLRSPLVDTDIRSNYIMSVRFNKIVALLERDFGLRGKTILSCGCGSALYEIAFAKRGATIWAYDISDGMLEIARHNAKLHDAEINFFRSDELHLNSELDRVRLPQVDIFWGSSILHHLASPETFRQCMMNRVHSNSLAVFCEPVSSGLVNRIRKSSLNIYHQTQTEHETAWTLQEYKEYLRKVFLKVEFLYPLNMTAGIQKILKKFLPNESLDRASPYLLAADSVLSTIPGSRELFTWHITILAHN
jgi:2-polyprenyl-3-methyl-5-hydroxy-6-metoxy-1,4-benzoquinol methylase